MASFACASQRIGESDAKKILIALHTNPWWPIRSEFAEGERRGWWGHGWWGRGKWAHAMTRLIRLGNVLLSGTAAIVGAYLASGRVELLAWLAVPLAPMLITAAGNIQNDLYDLEIDRLNRPDRPLVTGAINPVHARWLALLFYAAGLLASVTLGWIPLAIATLVVLLLNLYNASWSGLPLLGNLVVSSMGALPIIYGATSQRTGGPIQLVVPVVAAIIGFWLHLSRELLKDSVDLDGDRASGRRTLPIIHGPASVIRWAAFVMLLAAAISLWLGTTGWLGPIYMFGVCVTVVPALLYGAAQCWWRPDLPIASFWSGGLKLIMLAGLVWMVIAIKTP